MTTTADVQDETTRLDGLRAQLARARTQRAQFAAFEDLDPFPREQRLRELDAGIAVLEAELGEAEPSQPDALELLRRQRGPLALRVLDGDETAPRELSDLDVRIADAEHQRDLEAAAEAERQRLAQQAAQEALRAERARLESALEAKLTRRTAALKAFQTAILTAAALVPDFRTLDDDCHDLSVRLGRPASSLRGSAVELAAVHLSDAGLTAPEIELLHVPAASRTRLLEHFGEPPPSEPVGAPVAPEPGAGGKVAHVAACTVCGHNDRAAIEANLAAGVSLRELEIRYGIARSALSRHRRHGETKDEGSAA
jgi:hypothetical protein